MDRLRSFFDDLGLFDEEENNITDSDKSSIDTKSIDIEENAAESVVDSSPSDTKVSQRDSSRRRLSLTRNPSQRSVKSNVSTSIRRITNSMIEEDDDDDDDDNDDNDKDIQKTDNDCNNAASGLNKGEARSFTRFRFRSRSNIETERFPTGASLYGNDRATTKDLVSCKTIIPDDTAYDETPANLFGYACGVEFCTSMELMNKIQGNDNNGDDDDHENDGSILDTSNNNDDDRDKRAPLSIEKKRSFLWKSKAAGGIDGVVGTANNQKITTDTKTVTTEATGDSSSNSSLQTKTHLRRWGHSKIWTITALLFALTGCVCAILTRQSIHFVTLRQPLVITELYEPIYHMGIIRVQVCSNSSAVASTASLTESEDSTMNITTSLSSSASMLMGSRACTITRFTREEVSDRLFNLSRSLLTMGTYLGIALTLVLTTSIVWETINLRPIAFGYLIAYFFQSFSMLFFDTELCREYACRISTGGYLSIIASVCWIFALISVVRMDLFKLQSIRLRRREERKAKREARRQERKALALRKRQQRDQMMIIDNFQKNNAQSVDMLDIEAVLTSDAEYQTAVVAQDKKVMAL